MERVRAREIFCPHAQHVKQPPVCVTPPPKAILIEKIDIACAERARKGEDTAALEALLERLLNGKTADQAFLLHVLHLVDSNDEIFRRDYFYQRPAKFKPVVDEPMIDNADGFFDNLPELGPLQGKRKQSKLRLTKTQKADMMLQRYEQRQAELTRKI